MKSSIWTLAMALAMAFPAMAADAFEPPERGLVAAFNYPGLVLGPGEEIDLDLTLRNTGRTDDTFLVTVTESPAGWETEVRNFSRIVTGLFLSGQEQAGLRLVARPADGRPPEPGAYRFQVRVESLDGQSRREAACVVTVREQAGGGQALAVSTTYSELRGPSDSRFSFSLDIRNPGGEDSLVGLSVAVPDGWEAWFKPSYEDKQVSSIQIPKGQSRTLNLDVTPGFAAAPGRYPLTVRASSRWGEAEAVLNVELTGTYQIRLIAANELLSASTGQGRPLTMNFFVLNEGSAVQKEVKFLTVAPDNWKVEFSPPLLTGLPPRSAPTPVAMTVTPAADALVGDYGLGVVAEGERAKSPLDLRITVRAKAAWAWFGVGLIGIVLAGLGLTFRRLGRR